MLVRGLSGMIVSAGAAAVLARTIVRGPAAGAPPAPSNDNRFLGVNQAEPLTFTQPGAIARDRVARDSAQEHDHE